MSLTIKPRTRRSGELRVRSGCRICRQRRVKCPEQHPVCQHCQRLGLDCRYEVVLSWDSASTTKKPVRSPSPSIKSAPVRWSNYDVTVSDWMFLNATVHDFGVVSCVRETPTSNVPYVPVNRLSKTDHALNPTALYCHNLSFSEKDSRLFEYFVQFITPRCALVENPYQNILLRLVLTEARGPLMDCIMAVAANQMQIIGHGESAASALHRRDRALFGLRQHVAAFEPVTSGMSLDTSVSGSSSSFTVSHGANRCPDQLIWSAVMMCFFEISLDCPQSWQVHAEFASKLLLDEAARQPEGCVSDSHQFAAAYLSLHYTLSCSARASPCHRDKEAGKLQAEKGMSDSFSSVFMALQYIPSDSLFRTLAGCSKVLMALISEITELAQHPTIHQLRPAPGQGLGTSECVPVSPSMAIASLTLAPVVLLEDVDDCAIYLRKRRNSIERGLHRLAEKYPEDVFGEDRMSTDTATSATDGQMSRICEAKRLAALMYLYSRIDGSDPYKPHMVRLTQQIIQLISGISTRTNTVLWPLFIVATLGVRRDYEEGRIVVLTKLAELQQTRQLGNVRKARQVIEDVWKARDLRTSDAFKSWDILYGRLGTISLA